MRLGEFGAGAFIEKTYATCIVIVLNALIVACEGR